MKSFALSKAGGVALLLTLAFVIGWESYWRSQKFELSYNDDEPLWAYHRKQIYDSSPSAPVLIGSSRIKFGMDLSTWEQITGKAPVQLAQVGTSPRLVLDDLANDASFRGTVLVGVTEPLFFSPAGGPFDKQARSSLAYYPNWSLAQKASFHINQLAESAFLFLDEERFALRFLLDRAAITNRPGVFVIPPFPIKFTVNDFNRQTFITEDFVASPQMQEEQKQIWWNLFTKAPKMAMSEQDFVAILDQVKAAVHKIQARGGNVLFVRMPSDGDLWAFEQKVFPREKFWNRLLAHTGAKGIHFADYPQLAGIPCIEWSHLAPAQAKAFTREFIPLMQQQTGWQVQSAHAIPVSATSSIPTSTSR
ncbi:hypothetical protein Q0590_24400 [Rhodocytophaga aerolata]|uniref:Uncharacterized protein n=1 Tax=Rhodocytophaga aerolata TaxID=455078 RepID=A0ABT8RDL3_9BACT|nr:hypothetical protein [Rhodocytophaga aerolata]MDO1449439.1 hypothetical protein [Rhodocytophaga aerolata]